MKVHSARSTYITYVFSAITRWVPLLAGSPPIYVCMCVHGFKKFTEQTICHTLLYSYSVYVNMGQCPGFWIVFQVFNFFSISMNSKELLSNGPYTHPKMIITIINYSSINEVQNTRVAAVKVNI